MKESNLFLDAKYRVNWDYHGYRFSLELLRDWDQTLNYRIISASTWIESKTKNKVDTIIVSNSAIKPLIENLKTYDVVSNTINNVKVIFDLSYHNHMVKILSSKNPDFSVGIVINNLIGFYNDDF